MNTFTFFQFFGFLFLTSVSASGKYNASERDRKITSLSRTRKLTLQEARHVFENATDDFNNDFSNISILSDCNDAEAVEYVLSKSVNMDPDLRAEWLLDCLDLKIMNMMYRLYPGTSAFKIVSIFLSEMKKYDYEGNGINRLELVQLLNMGSVELVKMLVENGCELPDVNGVWIRAIPLDRAIGTIHYLIANGYAMSDKGLQIKRLLMSEQFTADDFNAFLAHGLPLNYKFEDKNWLDLALENGRFDIALSVYEKELKFSKKEIDSDIQSKMAPFVQQLALLGAFRMVRLLLIGSGDGGSILRYVPKDLIFEMSKAIYKVKSEAITEEFSPLA